jgi:hypothetical protein
VTSLSPWLQLTLVPGVQMTITTAAVLRVCPEKREMKCQMLSQAEKEDHFERGGQSKYGSALFDKNATQASEMCYSSGQLCKDGSPGHLEMELTCSQSRVLLIVQVRDQG